MHATEMLRDIPFFKALPEYILSTLESSTRVRSLEEAEIYISAGQPPRSFCVVLSGQLKFYRMNRSGKEQVFGFARNGDVFGLTGLTDPYQPAAVNCIARVPSEILEIELPVMREVMKREPELAIAVLREQSRRYSTILDLADQLSLKDAHYRLARWLDRWITENHPDAGDLQFLVLLPFTQSEIAAQIGTVREVVSRGFARMEKDGILTARGKRVSLLSRKGLRQMAEQ